MNVRIKNLALDDEGIEFEVRDAANEFLGDCYVTKAGLTWCKGKTAQQNGIEIRWKAFIKWMESEGA